MRRITLYFFFLAIPFVTQSQPRYPADVQAALDQTSNKPELERALKTIYSSGDQQKIKSVNFLIANMPIHRSQNYYWASETGQRIPYNELAYSSFKDAIAAFDQIKSQKGKLHPVPYSYRDIDSISADMIVSDIDDALSAARKASGRKNFQADENFFEYILPYRTSIEPLQNWRTAYDARFKGLINSREQLDSQMLRIGQNIKSWFTNTYAIENRDEPLPRLGAMQLLLRKKGACEDIADLAAFIARSQGYAAAVDYVPGWATASGVHFVNYINFGPGTKHHYDAADGYILDTLAREPAKVLRTTYSRQSQTIAVMLQNDTSEIPDNFMRLQNYKDVTAEYWKTSDLVVHLHKLKVGTPKAAYISVWNYSKWKPVWYASSQSNGLAVYKNMCKGVVYLPMYYSKGRMIPASWPVVNGYNFVKTLQPDSLNRRAIHIKEEPKYLAFRPGKKYALYYWKNAWVSLGVQIPDEHTKEFVFQNVPMNALLLLLPEYAQGKERPFIITESGERLWF